MWLLIKLLWAAYNAFGSALKGLPVKKCPPGSLKKSEADKLFKELAAKKNIPFDYPDDCCYSRAHEMCRIMKEKNIPCGKVWNYASPGNALRVETPNHPSGAVNWKYHVAPVVPVQGKDGVCRLMVMDPSLFDHPVSVDAWKKKQQDVKAKTELTDDSYYYRGPGNKPALYDPDYGKTKDMLAVHRNARDRRKAGK